MAMSTLTFQNNVEESPNALLETRIRLEEQMNKQLMLRLELEEKLAALESTRIMQRKQQVTIEKELNL